MTDAGISGNHPLLNHTVQKAYRFHLEREFNFIGRLENNDIILPMEGISDRHALVFHKEGFWYIIDLASRLGSRVNKKPAHAAVLLRDGDEIFLDRQCFKFEHSDQLPVPEELAREDAEREESPRGEKANYNAVKQPQHETDKNKSQSINSTVIMQTVKSGDAWLEIEKGPESGRRIPLIRGEKTTIARKPGPGINVIIDDSSISRNGHCRFVEEESGGWRIIDNDSTNGVVVEGKAITTTVLPDKSEIQLGSVVLRFHAAGGGASTSEQAKVETSGNDFYQNRTVIDNGKTQA